MRGESGGWSRFHLAVENALFTWIGISSACVMVAQFALFLPATRHFLTQNLSIATIANSPIAQGASVTIRALDKGSNSFVLINGVKISAFHDGVATVSIHPGDEITIESENLGKNRFEIDHNNPELFLPAPGQIVESSLGEPGAFAKARFVERKLR